MACFLYLDLCQSVRTISDVKKLRSFVDVGNKIGTYCFLPLLNKPDVKVLIASGLVLKSLRITLDPASNKDYPYVFQTLHRDGLVVSKDKINCTLNESDLEVIDTLKD